MNAHYLPMHILQVQSGMDNVFYLLESTEGVHIKEERELFPLKEKKVVNEGILFPENT